MSKTNELRKAVIDRFTPEWKSAHGVKGVSYEIIPDDVMYPHIVFSFDNVNQTDLSRDDVRMIIDVWDKSKAAANVENIADAVEVLFDAVNDPQTEVLPTYYIESRRTVLDEDKTIRHKQITITIQNYERVVE